MFPFLAITLFLGSLPVPSDPAIAAVSSPSPPPAASRWLGRVNSGNPGTFPLPRSFAANYRVSWGGLEAAQIQSYCTSPDGDGNLRLAVQINTVGLARSLYTLDASHLSVVDRRTLHPIRLDQTEKTSSRRLTSHVDFTPEEAVRASASTPKKPSDDPPHPTTRHYPFPGLYDMNSALLYLRSLPMKNGDEKTVALMTANSPYLVTIKVLGRGPVHVRAGAFPAIECALSLEKINKQGELEPRKGFKTAHAWLSDDSNRLLIKVEAQVFVGAVSMELEQVRYPGEAEH